MDGAASLLAHARAQAVPVAHVWTTVTRDPDNRMAHWKREGLWQCEAGTEGHAPPTSLAPRQGEPIVHKSGSSTPDIAAFVAGLGGDTVVVAGVKTHACVRQLALDAWQAGLTGYRRQPVAVMIPYMPPPDAPLLQGARHRVPVEWRAAGAVRPGCKQSRARPTRARARADRPGGHRIEVMREARRPSAPS